MPRQLQPLSFLALSVAVLLLHCVLAQPKTRSLPPPPAPPPRLPPPPPLVGVPPSPYDDPRNICPSLGTLVMVRNFPSSPFVWQPFTQPYAVPTVKQPMSSSCRSDGRCVDVFTIDIKAGTTNLTCPGPLTKFVGYDGTAPGPIIQVLKGREAVVRFNNQLVTGSSHLPDHKPCVPGSGRQGRPISVHNHGSASLAPWDGWAEDSTCGGESKDYFFPNIRAVTGWYHDHEVDITSENAYNGLAGFYLVRDEASRGGCGEPWNLDNIPDVPMMLADKVLDGSCQLLMDTQYVHHDNLYGDMNLVNGIPWPTMRLQPRWTRFRFCNAAVSRPWLVQLVTMSRQPVHNTACKAIAGDGGFRRTPTSLPLEGLFIGVGERYEIICDLTSYAGQELIWWNHYDPDVHKDVPYFCYSHLIAKVVVSSCPGCSFPIFMGNTAIRPYLDQVLSNTEYSTALADAKGGRCDRRLQFGRSNGKWVINGETWSSFKLFAADIGQNTYEVWCLETGGGWFHPIHIHLVDFYVLLRNGDELAVKSYEKFQPKDVVMLYPGTKVSLLARFGPHKGDYMFHCHNLRHEDDEMMRSMRLVGTAAGLRPSTALTYSTQLANGIIYDSYSFGDPMSPSYSAKRTDLAPALLGGTYLPDLINLRPYRIFYPHQTLDEDAYLKNETINPWLVKCGVPIAVAAADDISAPSDPTTRPQTPGATPTPSPTPGAAEATPANSTSWASSTAVIAGTVVASALAVGALCFAAWRVVARRNNAGGAAGELPMNQRGDDADHTPMRTRAPAAVQCPAVQVATATNVKLVPWGSKNEAGGKQPSTIEINAV